MDHPKYKSELCHKCKHPLGYHYCEKNHDNYKCWERNSPENNDFCGCQHGKPKAISLSLYVVRNNEGEYFYGKGYWGCEIADAKIYKKISPAKSIVTSFANSYKNEPVLEILELNATLGQIINQEERLKKITKQKEDRENIKKLKAKQE